MKPTDEQIKALRKGDVVTVRAVVNMEADTDGDILVDIGFAGEGALESAYVQPSEIMTIEPREIKVGDRVRYSNVPHDVGTVRHVEAGRAAIMFDSGVLYTHSLDTLQVIP